MAVSNKVETFTQDGQSTLKILRAFVLSSTTADTLQLRAGGSGGAVIFTYTCAVDGTTGQTFPEGGIHCPTGNWYVDITTTGLPKITLIGD